MKNQLFALSILMSGAGLFAQDSQRVYFGTYTNKASGSEGIYSAQFNAVTGELSKPVLAARTTSPSFLAVSSSNAFLYAVGENPAPGASKSKISAFKIVPGEGALTPVNEVDAGGAGPCYISLDKGGVVAMTAQYGDGSIASHKVGGDGSLSEVVCRIQHKGSGVDQSRQKEPHAHSIRLTPDNRYALACDLGANKVFIYKMDPASGVLTPHGEADLAPGAGPRHIAFHPNGRFVFVNNEMLMTVTTFAYDPQKGSLTEVGTVSTLPEADRGKKGLSTAETVAHPNGRFVYVSNRTHDTIAVFQCDPQTGRLTLIQNVSTEGAVPRNFALDLTQKWMIVAHQKDNSAAVFSVDPESGRLAFTGRKVSVGAPVCVKFVPAK